MAATIGFFGDMVNVSFGAVVASFITVTPDTSYPPGGYALTAAQCKVESPLNTAAGIAGIVNMGGNTAATGYLLYWNSTTGKVMILTDGAGTPAGTLSGNVVVKGGAIGEPIGINPDSNAGVLSKAAATDRTIPYATFLGGALAFTGTPGAAGPMQDLAGATNLSTAVFNAIVFGLR